ncbi:MAG: hypothetical protein QXU40_03620, partial [Candidatus Pacearchaeota archaeon]
SRLVGKSSVCTGGSCSPSLTSSDGVRQEGKPSANAYRERNSKHAVVKSPKTVERKTALTESHHKLTTFNRSRGCVISKHLLFLPGGVQYLGIAHHKAFSNPLLGFTSSQISFCLHFLPANKTITIPRPYLSSASGKSGAFLSLFPLPVKCFWRIQSVLSILSSFFPFPPHCRP